MGAILVLKKMPGKCSKCPLANKEVTVCRVRETGITAGLRRETRMPMCPLMNEGEYLSRIIGGKNDLFGKGSTDRAERKRTIDKRNYS